MSLGNDRDSLRTKYLHFGLAVEIFTDFCDFSLLYSIHAFAFGNEVWDNI